MKAITRDWVTEILEDVKDLRNRYPSEDTYIYVFSEKKRGPVTVTLNNDFPERGFFNVLERKFGYATEAALRELRKSPHVFWRVGD